MTASLQRPLVIGLTGGIGSGKTTVCSLFAKRGVEIIDADQVSRKLVLPGSVALMQLEENFGKEILLADGSLNRTRLRQMAFSDSGVRQKIEAILHPQIRSAIVQQIARSNSSWLILAAPLLLEHGSYNFVDRVLVVDADEAQQIARTSARDNCSSEEVQRIMQTQWTREQRLQRADDIISNNGNAAELEQQINTLYQQYESLAGERHAGFAPL